MQPEPINNTIQYQLTREETVSQLWRLLLRPTIVICLGVILLCGVGFALRPGRLIFGIALILFPILFLILYRRMLHKVVVQHPEFLEPQTFAFDDTGFTVTNSVSRIQWPWSRVRSVADTREYIVLGLDTLGSGAIIPKRALSPQQIQLLLSHASRKTS
jgi:hypothetical protein